MALTQIQNSGLAADAVNTGKIEDGSITYAKIQNISATNRVLGRESSGPGVAEEIAPAALRTMLNVEDGADATDATNVNAAGAIMHSDLGTKGQIVVGDGSGDATILAVGSNTHVLTADSSEASGVKWAAVSGGAALSNDANNRVVTADGSGGINGEAGLTFDGTHLSITDGDVVIATSGHGIDFSATADGSGSSQNELLADYEKGTWTPTMPNSSNTVTVSHAEYVRIGRVVHTWCTVQNTPSSTGDSITIGGMPFAVANNSWHGHGSVFWSHVFDSTNMRPGMTGSTIYFHDCSTGGHVTGSGFSSWDRYLIGMTYFAD